MEGNDPTNKLSNDPTNSNKKKSAKNQFPYPFHSGVEKIFLYVYILIPVMLF